MVVLRTIRRLRGKPGFTHDVGALWSAQVVLAALGAAQGLLAARWLGPSAYGIAALVMTAPAFVYVFLDARSSDTGVKYLAEFDATQQPQRALALCKATYVLDAALALLVVAVVAVAGGWLERSFIQADGYIGLMLVYASALVLRSPVGPARATFLTLGHFRLLAGLEILTGVVRAMLVIAIVAAGGGVAGVVWGNALAMAADGLVSAVVAHRIAATHWGESWLRVRLTLLSGRGREIARFIAYNDLGSLIGSLGKKADTLILGYYTTPVDVGLYSVAKSAAGVVGRVVTPLQATVFPRLARRWGVRDRTQLRALVRRAALTVGVPLAAALLVCVPITGFTLRFTIGSDYSEATTPTQMLVASNAVWLAFFWLRPLVLSLGWVRFWTANAALVTILSLLGFVLLASTYGAEGMAFTRLVVGGIGGHVVAFAYVARRWRSEELAAEVAPA